MPVRRFLFDSSSADVIRELMESLEDDGPEDSIDATEFVWNEDCRVRIPAADYGETMITDERSGASKAQKPARLSLVPADALRALATHYGQAGGPPGGPKKYDDWNWAKGLPFSSLIDAAGRHQMNFMDPEQSDYDEVTGTLEPIVIAWHWLNIAHYMMNTERFQDFDDRWGDSE